MHILKRCCLPTKLAGILAIGLSIGPVSAAEDASSVAKDAIGSWFGRAVPSQTICPPGSPGCPVPQEMVLLFTVNGDGTFIGTDSTMFTFGNRSTAHGQWKRSGPRSIVATSALLQASPSGAFIGSIKNLVDATVVDPNEMVGTIDVYVYLYTDNAGRVIVDAEGLPTPSPLAPASQCATTAGCTSLGRFSFVVNKVAVQ